MKMTKEHPIIPSPVLIKQWRDDWFENDRVEYSEYSYIATRAAQWGADQELDACCNYFNNDLRESLAVELLNVRRSKPSSLKEQALKELAWVSKHLDMPLHNHCNAIHTIHQALKKLDD